MTQSLSIVQKLRSELDSLMMDRTSKDTKAACNIKQLEEELNEERHR
jgi:hypothetical protein